MDIFESPKLLLDGVREKRADLKATFDIVFRNGDAMQVVQTDIETGNKVHKVVFSEPLPPKVRLGVSGALNDMRHALDQATCAAYLALTGREAPRNLYFPFANSEGDLNGRLASDFPPELHSVFQRIQPYPRVQEDGPGCPLLLNLNQAARNKHRVVARVGGKVAHLGVDTMEAKDVVSLSMPFHWDMTNNELLLGTTGPEGYIQCKVAIGFYVALENTGPFDGLSALSVIDSCLKLVADCIAQIEEDTLAALRARD